MLNAIAENFPEATSIFNFFYGVDAPVFLLDGSSNPTLIWSTEGPRQGCAAGTFLFCTGVVSLVSRLQLLYPEFSILALTDDINVLFPPPASDTPLAWQHLYRRYASFLSDLKSLSKELAGLSLNSSKCGMLLPEGAPPPDEDTKALFPAGFDFQARGLRIAGSPIGTDDFVKEFVENKLCDAVEKLQAIKSLGNKCARATHRLLITCGTKLLSFLAATVPPSLIAPALEKFDAHINNVFFGSLSPTPFECSSQRLERALLRANLPAPFGCSLFRAADQGKAAWLSSLAGCLHDPRLFQLRHGLSKFVGPAWERLVDAVGGTDSRFWSQVSQVVSSAESFLDGSLFSPMHDGKVKLSTLVLKVLSRKRTELFLSLTSPDNLSHTLTGADILRANTPTFAGRIFVSSLKQDFPFVLTNEQYIAWTRSFLGLPPANTIGNQTEQKDFDYPVQTCLALHRVASPFLDADGCHASANCPATYGGRMKKHNFIVRVLARAAKDAGLRVREEPDTHGLLLGEFSKAQCRRIFPKHIHKHYKDKFAAVLNAIELVASPSCAMSDAEKHAYVQVRIDALPAVKREDAKGLRIDLAMENDDTGESKWVDVTVVHTGAESYRDKEMNVMGSKLISRQLAARQQVPDPIAFEPSPTLLERTTAKNEKYARLLLVAKKQTAEKKRKQAPVFSTFAVSDYGEMAPVAIELQEWLVNQYRLKCEREGKRADGCKIADLVRSFRNRMRLGLQLAVAAGCGEMLCRAGQAWG
jgi:hypothetical protein